MDFDKLKRELYKKLDEAMEVARKCGGGQSFEINIKKVKDQIITRIEFEDEEKVS